MAKSKKHKYDSGSSAKLVVIMLILIIGLGSLFVLAAMKGPGGSTPAGGQSTSSLESQVETLTEQVKANPKDASLHENLGTALFNLANSYSQANDTRAAETFKKTIQVYNETLQLESGSKELLGDLATAYYYTNQIEQAISAVQKALKIDPAFTPALLNYGIYLADGKGDYANAIKQWEKVPASSDGYSQAQSFIKQYKSQVK